MFVGDGIVQQFEGENHRSISSPTDRFVTLPASSPSKQASKQEQERRWNVDRSLRLLMIGTLQQGNHLPSSPARYSSFLLCNNRQLQIQSKIRYRVVDIAIDLAGPISHFSYVFAARLFPGATWRTCLQKTGFLLSFNPPIQTSLTFTLTAVMAGGTLDTAFAKLKQDLPWTWGLACVFWGPIMTVNMRFVPVGYQTMVGGAAWGFWNCFLAYVANTAVEESSETTSRRETQAMEAMGAMEASETKETKEA